MASFLEDDQIIRFGAAEELVVAALLIDEIVDAGVAEQLVVAILAVEQVVAVAALDPVVAAAAENLVLAAEALDKVVAAGSPELVEPGRADDRRGHRRAAVAGIAAEIVDAQRPDLDVLEPEQRLERGRRARPVAVELQQGVGAAPAPAANGWRRDWPPDPNS